MKKFGIQDEVSKEVEACANSVHGQSALREIGVETGALQPALSSLPTITLNGVSKFPISRYCIARNILICV